MQDIYWAAGLFEGEGSIAKHAIAFVTQKDAWVLLRVRSLFGGTVGGPYVWRTRTFYRWFAAGARGRGFLMTIYPLLSPRRRQQIRAALEGWRAPTEREVVDRALIAIQQQLGVSPP